MTNTIRPLAFVSGSLFAATAAIDLPHDQAREFVSTADYVLEAVFTLALAAGTLTLLALLRSATSRLARVGFAVAGLGTATLAVVAGATFVNGSEVLDTVFPLGLLGIILGYLVLAVADLRRNVEPRFVGLALIASLAAMIALGEGLGVVAWAFGWFAVAALLAPAPARAATRTPAAPADK
jgi:hypothetical protein